jgi:hypothetical protein
VAHCWVLREQARPLAPVWVGGRVLSLWYGSVPVVIPPGFCLCLCVVSRLVSVLCGAGAGRWGRGGVWVGGRWVRGFRGVFENWIADASI